MLPRALSQESPATASRGPSVYGSQCFSLVLPPPLNFLIPHPYCPEPPTHPNTGPGTLLQFTSKSPSCPSLIWCQGNENWPW